MAFESVQELFEKVAAERGPRSAVERGDRSLSYSELSARSNRVANFLTRHGLKAGTPVALLLEDTISMVAGLLGVLKAGGLFVPLDPEMPVRRLATMTGEVQPPWFLAESRSLALIDALSGELDTVPGVLCLDDPESAPRVPRGLRIESFADFGDDAPVDRQPDPDERCYVYFTSGSTGRPKGIVGRLKGIDHFIRWEIETFGLSGGVRGSQLTHPTFDAYLRDVFVPLCSGGTLCVPEGREHVIDARRLAGWLDRAKVQLIHCVPSLFRALLAAEPPADSFVELEHVLLSGETLLSSDVERWRAIFGDRIRLVNLYGPSETTMTKLFFVIEPGGSHPPAIPIGKPMKGAAALLVDRDGRPCARGQVGEFLLRTPYRSHGYWNRPELTREVFIPNPFSDDPGDLVYRTGDLGRLLQDDNFEFLGRLDQQVKIRGLRVELGEIEGLLRRHVAVDDAVVSAREEGVGNHVLCAYVEAPSDLDLEELRGFLGAELPEGMIPAFFALLDELPRTLSGKVDHRALPAPVAAGLGRGDSGTSRTPVEMLLTDIWTGVLKHHRLGIRDNFFHSGGHSLLATQMLVRVREVLGVDLPLSSLFEGPTIAEMAAAIEQRMREATGSAMPPLERCREGEEAPVSFAQQRLWFIDQLEPGSPFYNIFVAVRLSGRLAVSILEHALGDVVRRHESLRTVFASQEGQPLQRVLPPCAVALPLCDLSALEGDRRVEEARELAAREARCPFDLLRGPLLRCQLYRLRPDRHVLTVSMHHIIADGWSLNLFVEETTEVYRALSEGRASRLPELPIQYADFALWQRRWLRGKVLREEVEFWRRQLAGAPAFLEIPTDFPRPEIQTYRGSLLEFELSSQLSESLRKLSRDHGVTLFMTLLAGFKILLSRRSGQRDLVVGAPISYRNWPEVQRLIGFFANTLVFRTDLSGDPTVGDLLKRVRRVALDAYTHQHVPLVKLVEELQPERSQGHNPLFQVGFNFIGRVPLDGSSEEETPPPDLYVSPFGFEVETSQFDLNLVWIEGPRGLRAELQYRRELFAEGTIREMSESVRDILNRMVEAPEIRLRQLMTDLEEAEEKRWVTAGRELDETGPRKLGEIKNKRRRAVRVSG